MAKYIAGRNAIVEALTQELLGPAPSGEELDFSKIVSFTNNKDAYGPWCQKGTGEEILMRDRPTKRYGIGVLYPYGLKGKEEEDLDEAGESGSGRIVDLNNQDDLAENPEDWGNNKNREREINNIQRRISDRSAEKDEFNDEALSLANSYRPSSMGISFLAGFTKESKLVIKATGGRYKPEKVIVSGKEREWWLRSSISLSAEYEAGKIITQLRPKGTIIESINTEELTLSFEVVSRPIPNDPEIRLLTISLVNRSSNKGVVDLKSLFQTKFVVEIISPEGLLSILPYPRAAEMGVRDDKLDKEEASMALLYRNVATYAIGHGCAANWDHDPIANRARSVSADPLPFIDTPSVTPDIKDLNGKEIKVSMAELAGLKSGDQGLASIERIVSLYERWITNLEAKVKTLDNAYHPAAQRHIGECKIAAKRIRKGLLYLQSDSIALRAFQLANLAILTQQARSRAKPRGIEFDSKNLRFIFSEVHPQPDILNLDTGRGSWRAFQIAFLLMSLESAVNGRSSDRRMVELIWFPTGGGKTEAYLGLAAFAIFMRRLRDPNDTGVHVLMRYTLRLLTTQQFQRASRLICAMEMIRRENTSELGSKPFTIGMWVGGASTPNTKANAVAALNSLQSASKKGSAINPFPIDQCPWCGAQMGPLKSPTDKGKRFKSKISPQIAGYERKGDTVIFACPDNQCEFSAQLPIYVIDEDVYDMRPTLVIGTVDKFALLAWKPEVRSLFGIGNDGQREYSPPGLIIQDELHLISGPLGSMVGLYEAVIEELCTDRRGLEPIPPKIISSTATTRQYAEQINALYARRNSALFPPPGLDAGDSFFGRYATDENGNLLPGRMYVGVHAPGLGSLQTAQVRTFTALLQAPMQQLEEKRDPWWTLMIFFNSLRELGTTLSLFQSDIPDYQKVLVNRQETREWRGFWRILELTGRANYEEVKNALTDLSISYPSEQVRPVDVCLASSILEVGVDIDRLSLMCVVGQPKTTAQYIQVTGRVGRRWWEKPGLVITVYTASKPRDRSHFEKFRSYHEKLYANVEPASVTPFSPPALERALHAIILAYVRQFNDLATDVRPLPYPAELINRLEQLLLPRILEIDGEELTNFKNVFARRSKEWEHWQPAKWNSWDPGDDIPLYRAAGEYVSPEQAELSWPTPLSMRNVDASCLAAIMPPTTLNESLEGEEENA